MADESLTQPLLAILSGIVVALTSGYLAHHRDRQRQIREEVFPQILEELDRLDGSNQDPSERAWNDIEYYQKYWVDPRLRNNIEELIDISEKTVQKKERLISDEDFVDRLPDGMATMRNGEAMFPTGERSWVPCRRFLTYPVSGIIDAEGPEEMRANMRNTAKNNYWHDLVELIDEWTVEYPEWPNEFWNALHEQGVYDNLVEYHDLRYEKLPRQSQNVEHQVKVRYENGFFENLFLQWNLPKWLTRLAKGLIGIIVILIVCILLAAVLLSTVLYLL